MKKLLTLFLAALLVCGLITAGTSAEQKVPEDTTLYYLPGIGQYYHANPNCKAVSMQHKPIQDHFTLAEANSEAYSSLRPCKACGAPARLPVDPDAKPAAKIDDWIMKELEEWFPDIAGDMKPLNLVSENEYAKVELVCGLIRGQDGWFVFALDDPEGTWSRQKNTYMDLGTHLRGLSYNDLLTHIFDKNPEEHKALQLWHFQFGWKVPGPDSTLTIVADNPEMEVYERMDIPASLVDSAEITEGVDLPDHITDRIKTGSTSPAKTEKVLDYNNPLDVSLTKDIRLTGIGVIDNQLHVQLHHLGESRIDAGMGSYPAWSAELFCHVEDGVRDPFVLGWDDTEDGDSDWMEFVFNCTPEELSPAPFFAEFMQASTPMPGEWHFDVPVSSVLAETSADANG